MAGSASGLARRTRDLVEEMPADREHALVHVALVEGGKEGGGHVEGASDAAGARVDHSGVLPDALLLVQNGDLLATVRLFIVHVLRERDDEVFRSAVPATSAQTRRKESGVAAEARGSASPPVRDAKRGADEDRNSREVALLHLDRNALADGESLGADGKGERQERRGEESELVEEGKHGESREEGRERGVIRVG